MENLVGKWGRVIKLDTVISPEDKEFLYLNYGVTVHCIEQKDDIITVKFHDKLILVKAEGLDVRVSPLFSWGDKARIIRKDIVGEILYVCWHYNEKKYYYYLKKDGKKIKTRYFEEELEKVEVEQ